MSMSMSTWAGCVTSFSPNCSSSSTWSWIMMPPMPMPMPMKKKTSSSSSIIRNRIIRRTSTRIIRCEIAAVEVSTSSSDSDEEDKIGARVKVKVPLKVYHIPKVGELDLTGLEGEIKQYVGVWKGKRISSNFPYKVQFVTRIQGRDAPVKFFAHLKEDEFHYL